MFAGDHLGQLVHVAVDQRAKGHHHPGAALRVGRGPDQLRLGGFLNGVVQFGRGRQRDLGLQLARGGVVDIRKAARSAFDQLAVDPVTDFLHGILPKLLRLFYTCGNARQSDI